MCHVFSTPRCPTTNQAGRKNRYNQRCTHSSYKINLHRFPSHQSHHSQNDNSISGSAWSLLILPQTRQQLPKLRLITPRCTTSSTLPTQIDQFSNTLPASSTGARILPILQELLGIASRLCNSLLFLGIVVLVEVVDVLLGGFDGLVLLLQRAGFPVLEREVAALAPLLDDFGLFFIVGAGRVVTGLVGDGAAWCYTLIVPLISPLSLPLSLTLLLIVPQPNTRR
jgi:hypothetical protein